MTGGGGGGGFGAFRLSMPGGDATGGADKRRGSVAVCCVVVLLIIALASGGGSAIWDAFSAGPSYVSLSATPDPASLRAERVFAQPPWRVRDGSEAGYLYGWTGPALAYRMAWKQPAAHGGSAGAGGNTSADEFALAMRVGGVLRRVGVSTVAASGHTLAVTPGGVVLSWGRDWDARRRPAGLLGRADGAFWRPAPVEGLTGEGQVVAVATGQYHSVAVMESGRVFTWGLNNRGQLGRPIKSKVRQAEREVWKGGGEGWEGEGVGSGEGWAGERGG
ncbi:unnamed protein product [Closterium sp. Naga37s-1]|nr:unnamed protein product [Closterium sp. Naga37s-1]